jgi:hypothetical protein
MKTIRVSIRGSRRLAAACFVSAPILLLAQLVFAQGGLTPPGPPAPTMKTLDQLEARTPISSLPFTISASGSYYLTKNLSVTTGDAITITANQVTVDLNGFTIGSTASPTSGTAVVLVGVVDIIIRDGHIKGDVVFNGTTYSGNGFSHGVRSSVGPTGNVRVSGLAVSGCGLNGINLAGSFGSNVVESCTVRTTGGTGIQAAVISHSTASECGANGIVGGKIASDCVGQATGNGTGLTAGTAINCSGESAGGGLGLSADAATNCAGIGSMIGTGLDASLANNCFGFATDGRGINANTAISCYGQSNTSQGISAISASNCYGISLQNRGINVEIASGSYGVSQGGSFGINASRLAIHSFGSSNTGAGIGTNIAIGCIGINTAGPAVIATNKYNMP